MLSVLYFAVCFQLLRFPRPRQSYPNTKAICKLSQAFNGERVLAISNRKLYSRDLTEKDFLLIKTDSFRK